MKRLFLLPLFFVILLSASWLVFSSCSSSAKQEDRLNSPPQVTERFLQLWQERQYSQMYDLISLQSQAQITREKFTGRYDAIAEEATIAGIDFELVSESGAEASPSPTPESSRQATAEVPVKILIHTQFLGNIAQENTFPLVKETVTETPSPEANKKPRTKQEWRVQWTPSLIFKELDDKTLVHLFPRIPKRGTIYDRNGQPLAVDADLKVVGVVPDLMNDKELTIASLARALQMPVQEVRSRVDVNVPSFYFVPVQTLPFGTTDDQAQPFFDMKDLGVVVQNKTFRVYPHGDAAAHVLGYMREVTEEQLKELAPKGYGPGDRVGDAGLEGQFETELAGQRGGVLATIAPEGNIVQRITQKPAQAGQDIYLSIDINIQKTAEAALGERTGSVVVLDPRDNSVLALASYPRFDPNDFIKGLTPEAANRLINDPRQPFLHRPLLATYPPGSTFKVVTGAAGLERGGFSTGSTVRCTPLWYGLGAQFVKANWQSVDRGSLTIAQGLMASCNPVFYEVALALDHIDPNILPQFARAFGFGAPSGIGMEEAAGNVPDPKWKEENLDEPWFSGDSVNMGIGQGFLLVTPLQIANLYSSLASGAELRKPLLVRKIVSPNGATREFTTEVIQKLPISESTLAHLRQGLTMVTQDPGGTSYRVFLGAGVDAAGKSGTAEDLAFGSDHVFFVAYANRANPSIVALMALEEGKSGSAEAAPKVRQILETHVNHS